MWKIRNVQKKGLLDALKANGLDASITLGLFLMAWLVTNIANTQFGEPWQDDGSKFERLSENDWPKSVKKWFVKLGEQASELIQSLSWQPRAVARAPLFTPRTRSRCCMRMSSDT